MTAAYIPYCGAQIKGAAVAAHLYKAIWGGEEYVQKILDGLYEAMEQVERSVGET
jgi:hypothetical protein